MADFGFAGVRHFCVENGYDSFHIQAYFQKHDLVMCNR